MKIEHRVPADVGAKVDVSQWSEQLREWPSLEWPPHPVHPEGPSRTIVLSVRFLIIMGLIALVTFLVWLFSPEHRGDPWVFWPLALGFIYRGLIWIMEWMYFARPRFEPLRKPAKSWTVDVLTTYCPGEPHGMVLRTLLAMKAIRYPHENYLCDEADDPLLKDACRKRGIHHVTRDIKTHAKARYN
ncbi:MAG TPA: hypothetical protein VIT23_13045 [Terrimicrobiaceae bacterium]